MASSLRLWSPREAGPAFVPVLVRVLLLVSIVSSLGAPLLPDIAEALRVPSRVPSGH